jgi:microcin C transport system permease protein
MKIHHKIAFILLGLLIIASVLAELWVSNRAICVYYEGNYYFPTYQKPYPGTTFGLSYTHEANYRELAKDFEKIPTPNWVWMPLIPYDPYESDVLLDEYPPLSPDFERRHFLGTDNTGRDLLARIVYGFRTIIGISFIYVLGTFFIAIAVGSFLGYMGGWADLIGQRFIEIWANMPFLYVIILISAIIEPNINLLLLLLIAFSWTNLTYYMRSLTYKEKSRDYVLATQALGASRMRIIFIHILPNTVNTLITFFPFSLASAITAISALDFLGFGLPPPTPSWGEILKQGTQSLSSPWIVSAATGALVGLLLIITTIGHGLKAKYDPKNWITYR